VLLKDYLTVMISVSALFISWFNYQRERKKSKNILLRLLVLSKAIKKDFESLRFNHRMLHFLPGNRNEDYEKPFQVQKESLEKKIAQFYELLLLNQKISDEDVLLILDSLMKLEQYLFELNSTQIDNFDDLDSTRAITNPMNREIELIESLVQQYPN